MPVPVPVPVSQFPDRFQACISVHCRVPRTPQWTCLFSSSCAALFRTMQPSIGKQHACAVRSLFDHTFRKMVTYRWTSYTTLTIPIDISSLHNLFLNILYIIIYVILYYIYILLNVMRRFYQNTSRILESVRS